MRVNKLKGRTEHLSDEINTLSFTYWITILFFINYNQPPE